MSLVGQGEFAGKWTQLLWHCPGAHHSLCLAAWSLASFPSTQPDSSGASAPPSHTETNSVPCVPAPFALPPMLPGGFLSSSWLRTHAWRKGFHHSLWSSWSPNHGRCWNVTSAHSTPPEPSEGRMSSYTIRGSVLWPVIVTLTLSGFWKKQRINYLQHCCETFPKLLSHLGRD